MRNTFSFLTRFAAVGAVMLLSACASNSGSNLKPGVATLPEVIASMGEPAMRWKDANGQEQLAYPRGPAGTQTYMAYIGADGRLERIEGVLEMAQFSRIVIGKSNKEDVLRLLGPSNPYWTVDDKANKQLIWEWNTCNQMRNVARFNVYFDAATGIVSRTGQYVIYSSSGKNSSGSMQTC